MYPDRDKVLVQRVKNDADKDVTAGCLYVAVSIVVDEELCYHLLYNTTNRKHVDTHEPQSRFILILH